ncbi:hypothetical protein P175DRAFT_0518578 [Aspergillus ochraceoroseus IBT 24754]|uniref:1,3-beta-glucanosyltransferase n=1 Tax=Aspergillus ochraceoroseus IBT 24754 TaxID=1392256 RepID=A0A2T5LPG1_9EURO|nr:uncharacterized protein P175DRAFT_0518578 [Aspergillus ochraceoroseus IBT 24754]PTU18170.1 hypothetical protein P175DRAFT_0518578 [Aspergillus ochraceoroseus IBT 24754]
MKLSNIIASTALFASSVLAADLDPIVIKGSKFFYKSNNTQFYLRGVAYQQEYSGSDDTPNSFKDPLADADACKRDVPYLQKLNANVIRVYAVDPTADHSACMNLLSNAGIYVIADLSSPGESIIRNDPQWTYPLFARYAAVIDDLSQYTNVIGFFAGNEVSNNPQTTDASAFVKAAVRDMKRYIKAKNYRPMGVGYATNDDASIRVAMANYFNCERADESIDFWGYNIYSWCGDSSFQKSGYDVRTNEFHDYSVPVFFAEYGCNAVEPRTFTEVDTLYGPQMNGVWSGGIVYMYFQEQNNYGLVNVNNGQVSPRADYSYLSKRLATATPTGVNKADYTPTNTALQSCPPVNTNWLATATPLPPAPNQQLCSCMVDSLTCVARDNLASKFLSTTFSSVCGYQDGKFCKGIDANATTGEYGAYSVCTPEEQLSFAMNLYYKNQVSQGNGEDACNFNGAASIQSASQSGGSTCTPLLRQAGTSGTGSVKASAAAAGASSSASSSQGAAYAVAPGMVDFGFLHLGAYVATAVVAGVGMIWL